MKNLSLTMMRNCFTEAVLFECRYCRCVLIMSVRYWRSVNWIFRQWKLHRCSNDWNTDGCTGGSRHTDQTYWPHLCGFPDTRECGRLCRLDYTLRFFADTNTIANGKHRMIGWSYAASRNKKGWIYWILRQQKSVLFSITSFSN